MSPRILVVEDEERIGNLVSTYLRAAGFEVDRAADGEEALDYLGRSMPDLMVLDLMLPSVSGEEICSYVRGISQLPIIILTAKTQEDARVIGLELGADDYVCKPFSPRELTARVKAVLRRSGGLDDEPYASRDGSLVIDWAQHRVCLDEQAISITPTEFRLLATLARHPGRVFSRQELADRVFGLEYGGGENSIYVHIKNLRQKLEADGRRRRIGTVHGVGYRWEDANDGSV